MEVCEVKRILIVEDSPSVLAILEDMLTDLGYDVTTATNRNNFV